MIGNAHNESDIHFLRDCLVATTRAARPILILKIDVTLIDMINYIAK